MRALLIDDDPQITRLACFALERFEGFEVAAFTDAAAGLTAAEQGAFDVAILDVMMPVIDGRDAFLALRCHPQTCNLPVIFLTAKNRPQDIQEMLRLGATDVITKPFDLAAFAKRIRTSLAVKSTAVAPRRVPVEMLKVFL